MNLSIFEGIKSKFKYLIIDWFANHREFYEELNNLYLLDKLIPNKKYLFECFKYCDLDNINLVIIGQDPYNKIEIANGLCFGTLNNKITGSLRNIKKLIKLNLNEDLNDYSLKSIALQHVLLINSELTYCNENKLHWKEFIIYIINHVINKNPDVIILYMGKRAQSLKKYLNKNDNIDSLHPSPNVTHGFLNQNIFNIINNKLNKNKKPIIKWGEKGYA